MLNIRRAMRPRCLPRMAGLLALVLSLAACLPVPTPAPPARPLPPPVVPAPRAPIVPLAGGATMQNLLALPPVPFEENRGQADPRAAYLARAGGMTAYYGAGTVRYGLVGHDPAEVDAATVAACAPRGHPSPDACETPPPTKRWWLGQRLVGAREAPPLAVEPAETVVSYFVGKHGFIGPSSEWVTRVPTYRRLVSAEAWPGIDVAYEQRGRRGLKTTYHLEPGADPGAVVVRWQGAEARIAEDGALVLTTPLGEVRESAPVAWQEVGGRREPVAVAHRIVGHLAGDSATAETEVGFRLGAYDPGRPLVIDPELIYASYLGGDGFDIGNGIAVDGDGNAYVVGRAQSGATSFPDGDGFGSVPGFDQTHNGGVVDAFVVKVNPSGTGLVYATYVGGGGIDQGFGIAVDGSGNAYVTGDTDSSEATFPDGDGFGSVPGFDQVHNGGGQDAFVV